MYLRTLSFRGKTEEEEIGDHDQPLDEVDEAILKARADEPFSSVRVLEGHTCLRAGSSCEPRGVMQSVFSQLGLASEDRPQTRLAVHFGRPVSSNNRRR
jgi:hypothetical protein